MSRSAFDRNVAAKSSKWTGLVETNPSRVVDALNLGPTGSRNSHGDDGEDFIFAMDAVRRVTESFSREVAQLSEWEGLVNAGATESSGGVDEALCRNVCELKADTMATDAMSSYYPPFVMLYFAAMSFHETTLTDVDKRVLNVIRDNWREMINRWWNEPQNTLKQDDSHEPERLVVSRLLGNLLIRDPSVYSIIFAPEDHTLSVISRHWAHSLTSNVARSTMVILRSITFFTFSQNVEEYLKDQERPTIPYIMSKFYSGLSQSTPEPQILLNAMSTRLAFGDPAYAVEDLSFCNDLYLSYRELGDNSFADVLRSEKAGTYWRNAFKLMLHDAKSIQKEVAGSLLHLAVKLVIQKPSLECAQITQTWISAGMFDVLDLTMADLIRTPGLSRVLVFLFTGIKEAAYDFPPDLLSLVKDQLPRQRAVGAVLKYDAETQTSTVGADGKPKPLGEGMEADEIPDANDPIWNQGLWQAMGWLQGLCHDRELCTRRGCGEKGVSKCSSCKEFMYCGVECQKLDWKEHKQICKFTPSYIHAVNTGKNRLTRSKAAELGLINADPSSSSAMGLVRSVLDIYMTPILFIIVVVAGQYLGIFEDLGKWYNGVKG